MYYIRFELIRSIMKKAAIILLVFCAQFGLACNCGEFKQVQKAALAENKLMLVHFSNFYTEDDNGNPILNPIQEKQDLSAIMSNYAYVCVNNYHNSGWLKKLNINGFAQLLILDGNGKELYRFSNYEDPTEFVDALQNFSFSRGFFSQERQNFKKDQSYHTALRVAQKYFDYSLLVEQRFKKGVFAIGQSYIAEAEEALSKKDKAYAEKLQKIALFKLFHWAYEKNFSFLNQELVKMSTSDLFEGNSNLFYFLKYVTAKALQQEDFLQIEARTKTIDGFEFFVKKADIILNEQA